MLSLLMQLAIELWWLIALIACALIYAARVDDRMSKDRNAYLNEMSESIRRCEYDRDTF